MRDLTALRRRVDALAAADPELVRFPDWPEVHPVYFGEMVCEVMHPDHIGDQPDPELRRFLWGWWHMIEFQDAFPPWYAYMPANWSDLDEILLDAVGDWLRDDCPTSWNPVNPATVHWIKQLYKSIGPGPVPILGVDRVQKIDPFLLGKPMPWKREFNPAPDSWPAEMLERVRESGSLCPEPVPEFDWTKIGRCWAEGGKLPFPRHHDGRPIRGHFGQAEANACGT